MMVSVPTTLTAAAGIWIRPAIFSMGRIGLVPTPGALEGVPGGRFTPGLYSGIRTGAPCVYATTMVCDAPAARLKGPDTCVKRVSVGAWPTKHRRRWIG